MLENTILDNTVEQISAWEVMIMGIDLQEVPA